MDNKYKELLNILMENKGENKTLYIHWSSIFDNPKNKYDVKVFSKILKNAGVEKVWSERLFGWTNQPKVVVFEGLSAKKAENALNSIPFFKKYGAIIHKKDW